MFKLSGNSLILFLILFAQGCVHKEDVDGSLILRKTANNLYEIEVPIRHEGQGNIHKMDPYKYKFYDSHWIYSESDSSIVYFDKLVLTYKKNKTESPWKQSKLRGYIEFQIDSLSINLTVPVYKDQDTTVDGWADYKYNGTYSYKRIY